MSGFPRTRPIFTGNPTCTCYPGYAVGYRGRPVRQFTFQRGQRYEEMSLFNSITLLLKTLCDMTIVLYFTVVFIYIHFHIYHICYTRLQFIS